MGNKEEREAVRRLQAREVRGSGVICTCDKVVDGRVFVKYQKSLKILLCLFKSSNLLAYLQIRNFE